MQTQKMKKMASNITVCMPHSITVTSRFIQGSGSVECALPTMTRVEVITTGGWSVTGAPAGFMQNA